jgi:hypothetical protein
MSERPTIKQLEEIMDKAGDRRVTIHPNGDVTIEEDARDRELRGLRGALAEAERRHNNAVASFERALSALMERAAVVEEYKAHVPKEVYAACTAPFQDSD